MATRIQTDGPAGQRPHLIPLLLILGVAIFFNFRIIRFAIDIKHLDSDIEMAFDEMQLMTFSKATSNKTYDKVLKVNLENSEEVQHPPYNTTSAPTTGSDVIATSNKTYDNFSKVDLDKHSIHLNSFEQKKSRYDYEMIVFIHENATECVDIFSFLNYTVHIKPVPFPVESVRGGFQKWVRRAGCCGEKEWLKLYSYTLHQYPVVVHMDLDCLVLKPLDALFDAMILPQSSGRERISIMWNTIELPNPIDAFFTRDYGMIGVPGRKMPHQIGIQGGFLVVRPNQTVFEEYISIILEGNYTESSGWGGHQLGYGGYYGAGTIQGLAAYYYGHLHPEHSVELNRCIYNNMVDSPYPKPKNVGGSDEKTCLTMERECDDCRETSIDDIVTIHLTNCLKPWKCAVNRHLPSLCLRHHYEWYRIRSLVEAQWRGKDAVPLKKFEEIELSSISDISLGYCQRKSGKGIVYQPINFQHN
eukprot:CAMPEP_0178927556 /NCGR_PEP_ID=MMETSP0786-20121207/19267_1 /TAXON_ID=186022 /ORGANISM="Thalassionema frauenfeldii, Strain CCMP 1798" /LENGTH=471 /DNA_ID=CAMNT_0020603029 /DNA_START=34 /DNA_END=1447 /DNA_ORIENTATION=+